MAVGYRSSSASGSSDAQVSSFNIPVPAGAASGDIALLCVEAWLDTATDPVVTWPAGFTQSIFYESTTDGFSRIFVAWKRLTGADAGNYAITLNASYWTMGHAILVTGGASTGDPIEATNTAQSVGTSLPSTSVTTTTAPFLAHFVSNENSATHTPPTSFTEVQDGDYIGTSYRIPGASGTQSVTGGSTSASTVRLVALVAVKAEGGGSGATPTPAAIAGVAALPQATPSVADAGTPAAVTAVAALPQAVPAVADAGAPAAVAVVSTLPQATVTGNAVVTPGVITAVASVPRPAVTVSVVPAAVAAVAALPTPAPLAGGNVSVAPAAVAAVVALPSSARLLGATVSPGAIVTFAAVPRPAVGTATGPSSIAVLTSLPTAVPVTASAVTRTPSTIAAVASVRHPSTSAEGAGVRGRIGELSPRTAGGVATPRTFELGGTIR